MDFKALFKDKKKLIIIAAIAIALIIFLATGGKLSDLFAPAESGSDTTAAATVEVTDAGDSSALPTEPQQTTATPAETTAKPAETTAKPVETTAKPAETTAAPLDVNGTYTSKEDVALYLHTYGKLPNNFVTKTQANAKGWSGGSLENFFPGCAIGGDYFGNAEKRLPTNTKYHECDIDTLVPDGKGGWKSVARGAKRIVYSDDGHIYYTEDHYETFTQLY